MAAARPAVAFAVLAASLPCPAGAAPVPETVAFGLEPWEQQGDVVSLLQHGHASALDGGSRLHTSAGRRAAAAGLQKSKVLMWALGHHRGDQRADSGRGRSRGRGGADGAGGAGAAGGPPPAENASCNGSGYFIDWGSSGMKVYRAHRRGPADTGALPPEDAVAGSLDDYKLSGLSAASPPATVQAALDGLLAHLPAGTDDKGGAASPEGAILATAGMRLEPDKASTIWASVRAWAGKHPGFLGSCGPGMDNRDCRTLAGSQEAAYEMRAALYTGAGRELAEGGRPFGFASAGGASLQVGVRGPEAELRRCLADLGTLDAHFDPQRASVADVGGAPMLLVSFLSITDLPNRTCVNTPEEQGCDYDVGGLDQMRARFDEFLVAQGNATNPCLSPHTQLKADSLCQFFDSAACVLDQYGGKISGLPPANDSLAGAERKEECHRQVRNFLEEDLVLGRWSSSASCLGLAGGVDRWALLSSFARDSQLGADVGHGWETFADVQLTTGSLRFASRAAAERGEEGVLLSSALLVFFLEELGVIPSAELRGMKAEWADEAMRERGLFRGWALPGHCPGDSGSAAAPGRRAAALDSGTDAAPGWRGALLAAALLWLMLPS